jgi:RpiB/LacA/LacB family sugar-phosphate isomerase
MRIVLGSDHAGFDLKQSMLTFVRSLGHAVSDAGAHHLDPADDYPDFAEAVGLRITEKRADRGVLICGSGVGASIACNKIPGIRAAVCHDDYSAHQGVEHDNMNVIVLGSRIIGPYLAQELVRTFLAANYTGEPRHARRLQKVLAIERRYSEGEGKPRFVASKKKS